MLVSSEDNHGVGENNTEGSASEFPSLLKLFLWHVVVLSYNCDGLYE